MSTRLRARKAAATPPDRPRTRRPKEPGTGLRLPAAAGSDEDAVATERRIRLPIAGDRLFVGAVAKSFQVLELLSASGRGLTLMELAERSGLGKSATQRAAHTLRVLGYLSQHPDTRAYSLSYRMLELTHTVLAEDRVRMASLPHLEALSHACGETVNLTRWLAPKSSSSHAFRVDIRSASIFTSVLASRPSALHRDARSCPACRMKRPSA